MDIFVMGFVLGAVAGALIVAAWMSDRAPVVQIDPNETGVHPL